MYGRTEERAARAHLSSLQLSAGVFFFFFSKFIYFNSITFCQLFVLIRQERWYTRSESGKEEFHALNYEVKSDYDPNLMPAYARSVRPSTMAERDEALQSSVGASASRSAGNEISLTTVRLCSHTQPTPHPVPGVAKLVKRQC